LQTESWLILTLAVCFAATTGCTQHNTVAADDDTADDDQPGGTDLDGDGYDGGPDGDDCDDADPLINPGVDEICDGIDNDCDEQVDEDFGPPATWWADADADGYGNPLTPFESACDHGPAYVQDGTDCDDSDASVHPGAEDTPCDGVDGDCDGVGEQSTASADGVEYDTIQLAVDEAPDGTVVHVCPGTHVQRVVIDDERVLDLVAWSGSAEDTVLDDEHKWAMLLVG
jgi:hypothetical protein